MPLPYSTVCEIDLAHECKVQAFFFLLQADCCMKRAIPILRARVPILRVDHLGGFSVDISSVSCESKKFSLLLKAIFEGSICPELRPLSLFLKWSLLQDPDVKLGDRVSSFKLRILVMCYLQQRQLLPPLQPLMDDLEAGRPLQAPSRRFQEHLLGDMYRDLLAFLNEICGKDQFFFDLRTGQFADNKPPDSFMDKIFVCPDPYYPKNDIFNFNKLTVERLQSSCAQLSNALRSDYRHFSLEMPCFATEHERLNTKEDLNRNTLLGDPNFVF